jgi:hypothetical protein
MEVFYMKKFDIIVVGGGISGAVAAISAARNGSKVLIVEQHGFLGGMLTAAGVGPMMTFHVEDRQVVQGITGELIDRMIKKGKSPGHIIDAIGYTYTVTPFDAEWMKHELELMLLENQCEVLYHSMLAGVEVENGIIKSITVCNKAGLTKLYSKVFLDATGDGDLSAWAGVDFIKGREKDGAVQPMTANVKMANVNTDVIRAFIKDNPDEFPYLQGNASLLDVASKLSVSGFVKTLDKAKEAGVVTYRWEGLLFFETNNPGEVIVNTTRIHGYDSTDPWSLSEAEIVGRKQVRELELFLRDYVPGFENATMIYSGPSIGVRSSRQIKGVYTLNQQDILTGRKFNDVIAHAGYPIDVHSPDGKEEIIKDNMHLRPGVMYSVPYSCLINDKVTNLITVGRCISTTFEAQGAIRTTPTAGAIGHGGGIAASLAAKNNICCSNIDIAELQSLLQHQGAFLNI